MLFQFCLIFSIQAQWYNSELRYYLLITGCNYTIKDSHAFYIVNLYYKRNFIAVIYFSREKIYKRKIVFCHGIYKLLLRHGCNQRSHLSETVWSRGKHCWIDAKRETSLSLKWLEGRKFAFSFICFVGTPGKNYTSYYTLKSSGFLTHIASGCEMCPWG